MDCLITTLKGSVDGANEVFGNLKLDVSTMIGRDVGFSAIATNKCKLKLHGVALQVGTTVFTDEVNIPVGDYGMTVVSSETDGYIEIINKYDFDDFSLNYSNPLFSTKDLKYCIHLTYLALTNTQVTGNIEDLSGLTKLISLGLGNNNVGGDVTAFLDAMAEGRENGEYLVIYVNDNCYNVPTGIGNIYATRGKVVFDGNGGYTVTTP